MNNSKLLILLNLLGFSGCEQEKGVEKRILLDVTKSSKISFIGKSGDKVYTRINGKFSGSIKIAMVGNNDKLTDSSFTIFKDSINLNIGKHDIYQDNTGIIFYVKPNKNASGKILLSMTEYIE
ncbi:hypothetical protein [Spirosoma pollinicola]|uniref:Lipoprotein n=1 Tax=Spirosoma pollinicola TaxID=2057025 RepID=A0A2K8YUR3_9BACT|nr:hypothetical protein [Spirosoma pollinicola]AUD01370.1 hypothetical protein CWM47_05825 [Spirosoma pollinicola]